MDFNKNSQESKTYSPVQVLQLMILNTRKDCLNKIYEYNRRSNKLGRGSAYLVKTSIQNLFLELKPMLIRWVEEVEDLQNKVNSKEIEQNLEAFDIINYWLDKKGLLKFDTGIDYDTTDPELENIIKGL